MAGVSLDSTIAIVCLSHENEIPALSGIHARDIKCAACMLPSEQALSRRYCCIAISRHASRAAALRLPLMTYRE